MIILMPRSIACVQCTHHIALLVGSRESTPSRVGVQGQLEDGWQRMIYVNYIWLYTLRTGHCVILICWMYAAHWVITDVNIIVNHMVSAVILWLAAISSKYIGSLNVNIINCSSTLTVGQVLCGLPLPVRVTYCTQSVCRFDTSGVVTRERNDFKSSVLISGFLVATASATSRPNAILRRPKCQRSMTPGAKKSNRSCARRDERMALYCRQTGW